MYCTLRNPNNKIVDIVFAMVRCTHSCDFTLNLVHFWIEMRIKFFSHSDHLMLKVVACVVRVSRASGTSLKLLGVSRPLKEGKV